MPRQALPTPRRYRELSSRVLMVIVGSPRYAISMPRRTSTPRRELPMPRRTRELFLQVCLLALVLPLFQLALLSLDFPSYSAKYCRMGD